MSNPLRDSLESGLFVVTAEITPPRGADFDSLSAAATILKPAVTAINLTDGAGARVRMSSLTAAIYLKQMGVEPILQVTCRDRNRIAGRKRDAVGTKRRSVAGGRQDAPDRG